MLDWNVVVTVVPGPAHERELIGALCNLGEFHRAQGFKDVCIGRVAEVEAFLGALAAARAAHKGWAAHLARVIPVEHRFAFGPDTLVPKACEAVDHFVDRMTDGSFFVRLERRGLAGAIDSPAVEQAIADHLVAQLGVHGRMLTVDFADPDYIVVAETLGEECGVGLISRAMRTRYPFVHPK